MLQAAAPKGWLIARNRAGAYDSGIDVVTYNGHPSAFLKSNQPRVQGFGTLMQSFRPDHYLGKRVRFRALVKTEGAKEWAGLWMRVDKGTQTAAFDNMQDRSITRFTNWQKYEVVLDVPQDATSISFGVLLSGSGEVWFNSAKFEAVGPTVLPNEWRCHPETRRANQFGS